MATHLRTIKPPAVTGTVSLSDARSAAREVKREDSEKRASSTESFTHAPAAKPSGAKKKK